MKAVIQPQESTSLDVVGMTKLFLSRQHGQPVGLLVAHITESFNLLPMATPHDMFRVVHKHLMVCTPLQGLSDPKFVIQCQTCLECFSSINCSSHTRMRYTQTNLPPALKRMQFDYGIWTSTPAIALSWILPGAAHIENNPGWESPSFRMRTPHTLDPRFSQ